ncbi:MAG: cytochrome c [Pyrinomonadaceae bacterium]|nr:cytochrome c [Pyrinomonadaceae bacterium]
MNTKQIKLSVLAVFAVAVVTILSFQNKVVMTVSADGDVAAEYKSKCIACHGAAAAKNYDPAKTEAEHVQIILKGKTAAKPPNMPGYEAKGMTEAQAKALAEYMQSLRTATPPSASTATAATIPAALDDETAAFYKKTCIGCHGATANKSFDATKADDVLVNVVMTGKKGEKPPNMPEYTSKGMTNEKASALVAYMKSLKQ